MPELTRQHNDLASVMALVRDEIGEDVRDVERQVPPDVRLRRRHTSTCLDAQPEERLSEQDRQRLALAEARDAAYESLRDLEHDLRTGKVGEADYEAERDRLRAEAARALRELDRLR